MRLRTLTSLLRSDRMLLMASQATGQMGIVAAMPFLTRQFSPSEFGGYQLAFTIGVLFQPFITLRFDSVIPSEATDSSVNQSLSLVVKVSSLLGVIWIGLLLTCFLLDFQSIGMIVLMAGMIALAYSATALDNALLIRAKAMRRLSMRNLLGGLVVGLLQLILSVLFETVVAVAAAILLGRIAVLLVTSDVRESRAFRPRNVPLASYDWGRIQYRVFGDLGASASLSSLAIYSQVVFGPAATAFVGTAQRTTSAPLGIISQALSQSVQAELGEAVRRRDHRLLELIHFQMRSLLPYAMLACVGLIVLGPVMAVPVFGPGWETAGTIIAILGVPTGLQLIVSPITAVFLMIGEEKRLFIIQWARFLLSLAIAVIFQLITGKFEYAVAGFSLGTSVSYAYTYFALRYAVQSQTATG